MANMSFGVNILPKANNTYTLGNSTYKWDNLYVNEINGQAINSLGLPTVTSTDNGKILKVVEGDWAVSTMSLPSVMTGATASTDGASGLVPAPATTDITKFLRGDGTWAEDTWGGITYTPYQYSTNNEFYVPIRETMNGTSMLSSWVTSTPGSNRLAKYDANSYLYSTTPTSSDNSTKVATTAFVASVLPSTMTGATSSAAGTAGLIPAPASADREKFFRGDGTWQDGGKPMVILSYGNSTWNDFITAYQNNVIVYCRASSNSNPATGSQTRMAFMAYVSDATNPTNVEFQYYRSMNTHSATAMGDEVYVYKLTNANGGTWTVTTRKASIKEIAVATGSKLGVSWSSDKVTLSNTMTADDMPMSSSDATTAKAAIDALNSKISTASVTSATSLSEVQNSISAFASNMAQYEVRYIIMEIYPASPPFAGTRYVMQVTKFDQSRIYVNAWRGNGTADYPIYGKYNDSAWTWNDLNSKISTSSPSFDYASTKITTNACKIRKCANVVIVYITMITSGDVSNNEKILTLPSGARPVEKFAFYMYNGAGQICMQVDTNGEITTLNSISNQGWCYGICTFVVS